MCVNISVIGFFQLTQQSRQHQRGPNVDRERSHLVSGSEVEVSKAGMKLMAEGERNGVGRLQGQAERNSSPFSVACLVLATFLIATTKCDTRSSLKKEKFILAYNSRTYIPSW